MAGPVKNKRSSTRIFSIPYQHNYQSNTSDHQKFTPSQQDCQYYHGQLDDLLGIKEVTYLSKRHQSIKRLDTLVAIKPWLYRWRSNLNNICEVAKKKNADQRLICLYANLDNLVKPKRSFGPAEIIKLLSTQDNNPDFDCVENLAEKHDRLLEMGFSSDQVVSLLNSNQVSKPRPIDIIYNQFAKQLQSGDQLSDEATQKLMELSQDPCSYSQIFHGKYDYLLEHNIIPKKCNDDIQLETDSGITASSECSNSDHVSIGSASEAYSDCESDEDNDFIEDNNMGLLQPDPFFRPFHDFNQACQAHGSEQLPSNYPWDFFNSFDQAHEQAMQDQEEEYQQMLGRKIRL